MSVQARRNVLFITSDQQHWNTLGCLNSEIRTPNLDRLAEQGTLFTRAYTVNPTCTPTRASWITGTYPSQHGAYSLGTKLPESVHTIGEDYRAAGFRSALIGKAHFQPLRSTPEYPSLEAYPVLQDLEFWRNYRERFYGFDEVELARNHVDEAHVGQHYALWMEQQGCHNWRDYFRAPTGTRPVAEGAWEIPEEYHYNHWIAQRTNARMEEYAARGENFFLWASFFDPHPPYLVPEPWASLYDPAKLTLPSLRPGEHAANPPHFGMTQEEDPDFAAWEEPEGHWMHGFHSHCRPEEDRRRDMALYYGMVTMMDHYIGKILDRLEALGLADNTLVVFTTDHGHFFGQHGLTAKGAFHYEDLLRVPLIARLPGQIPAGKRSGALQSCVDLAPTFLGFSGVPVPRCMTGLNLREEWCGLCPPRRTGVLVENHHQPTTLNLRTFIDARYKLTIYRGREYGELFDLQNDPGEFDNLWDSPAHQALKGRLCFQMLQAEIEREPLPMPRIYGA